MSSEELPAVLERNAACPICHKFYHNIDAHNNPVPSAKNKRTEEELCQCRKGVEARELRRQWRLERDAERETIAAQAVDFLGMEDRNNDYWKRIRKEEEVRRKNGITTAS